MPQPAVEYQNRFEPVVPSLCWISDSSRFFFIIGKCFKKNPLKKKVDLKRIFQVVKMPYLSAITMIIVWSECVWNEQKGGGPREKKKIIIKKCYTFKNTEKIE